jgi:hypothetical protein
VPHVDRADLKNDQFPSRRPSLQRRSPRALTRFLITFCIGVAATLAWQSYGDAARDIIAGSYAQLGWLAPQSAPIAQNAPDVIAPIAPAAASPDQQQLSAMALDLDAVRQSIDRIAASQEQMTRNVDQLAAGQEQMTRDAAQLMAGQEQITRDATQLTARQEQMTSEITKLQAVEQQSLQKNSERAPRPAPALARNPVLRSSLAPMIR